MKDERGIKEVSKRSVKGRRKAKEYKGGRRSGYEDDIRNKE